MLNRTGLLVSTAIGTSRGVQLHRAPRERRDRAWSRPACARDSSRENSAARAAARLRSHPGKPAESARARRCRRRTRTVSISKRRQPLPGARGVHRIGQVAFGIDQRAVEIEDQKIGTVHCGAQFATSLRSDFLESGLCFFFNWSSQVSAISRMLSRNASLMARGASAAHMSDASMA